MIQRGDSRSIEALEPRAARLRELAWVFLKLGSLSFGGPAAHTAMMEDEVVHRRRWLDRDEFLDLVGAANLIPGPNSTELAIHIGHRRAGWAGLLVSGIGFILPAVLIVAGIAWAYVRFGSLPQGAAFLYGVKPVVLAVIALALWRLGRAALKSRSLLALCLVALGMAAGGVHELYVLFGVGTLAALLRVVSGSDRRRALACLAGLASLGASPIAGLTVVALPLVAPLTLGGLFLVFLKVGAVLYGSGYVLFAFLRADLVERLHWLTQSQLLDAIAVGQITPGPLFSTATFVGWILAGPGGAAAATVGIFLPAFAFVALSGLLIPRLRRSPVAGAFLDGVIVASLALMGVVTWQLAGPALPDVWTVAVALLSAALLSQYRVNPAALVLGGGLFGIVVRGWVIR